MLHRLLSQLRTLGESILGKMRQLRKKLMPKDKNTKAVNSSAAIYGWKDDGRPLPFVQLGDVFVRDAKSWVFAVINASCDLQVVPVNVRKKGRTRDRDNTVLLLPGEVCELGTTTPKALTTELFKIAGKYRAIEWMPKQMVSIPQCCLRTQLQDRGYLHNTRLQMDRAIELQQEAFVSNSRVGLEVQPQLSRPVGLRISAKAAGGIKTLGDDIPLAGTIFHTRDKTVVVVNHDSLVEMKTRLEGESDAGLADAKSQFNTFYTSLHRCPFVAKRDSKVPFNIIRPNSSKRSCKAIYVGLSSRPKTIEKCDGQLYFHFFDEQESNAD